MEHSLISDLIQYSLGLDDNWESDKLSIDEENQRVDIYIYSIREIPRFVLRPVSMGRCMITARCVAGVIWICFSSDVLFIVGFRVRSHLRACKPSRSLGG